MDPFEEEDSIGVFSDTETVPLANRHRALYGRDQLKDDIMDELGDDEEENGGPENRTKKKLNKQVIIFELKCPQTDCILSFKSLEQLYQHQEAAHGIMAYNCLASGCSEQYNIRVHMRQHYSKVHRHHTNWTCPRCDVIRNNSQSLRNHIRELHQFGRFGCWYDGCSFEADLRMKVRRHRFKAHPRLICSINGCDKGFYYESQLKLHSLSHSATSKLSDQIGIDENNLNQFNSSKLSTSKQRPKKKSQPKPEKRQMIDVNNEVINSKVIILGVNCPQSDCGMMVRTMYELYQHQKSVHGVLQYPCPITGCSEQFDNGIKIGYHHSTVHPHLNWVCSKCNIKFVNQYKLRNHNHGFHHYGHFQCGYAECTFEADLRSKVDNHHERAHARYSCPIGGCDFVAYNESKLKKHQLILHATVREESSPTPEPITSVEIASKKRTKKTFHSKVTKRPKMMSDDDVDDETVKKKIIILELKCPQSECNSMLSSFSQLRQHQQDAHSVLAFSCLVAGCSEQFSNRLKIGHHYSTVHPRHTDWTCPQCNVKMKNATLLRQHIRDYHQFGQFHCAHLVCTFEADLRSKVQKHIKNMHN